MRQWKSGQKNIFGPNISPDEGCAGYECVTDLYPEQFKIPTNIR